MRIFKATPTDVEDDGLELGKIYYREGAYVFGPFETEDKARTSYNNKPCDSCED